MKVLNFGSNSFKLNGFTNIDIDEANKPDVQMDIRDIRLNYIENEVDFIHAGHFFEHISWEDGKKLMQDVHAILKPYASIVITVPDYTKTARTETVENAERIILNYGNHVTLYNITRLEELAKQAGFTVYMELDLGRVPWILLPAAPAGVIPTPEKWQTSFLAMKTLPVSMEIVAR